MKVINSQQISDQWWSPTLRAPGCPAVSRGRGAGQQAVPQQVPLQLRQVGVRHRHEGHLQEGQGGDLGVL